MNMLTPAIDKFVDCNQIKEHTNLLKKVALVSFIMIALTIVLGLTIKPQTETALSYEDKVIEVMEREGVHDGN